MTSLALADPVSLAEPAPNADLFKRVRQAVKAELCGLVDAIDRDGHYPEAFMRRLGELGAYRPHLPADGAQATPDLASTIEAMSIVAETCTSTGFMTWCQATLAWYVANSENAALKARFGEAVASGAQLGGTGLSNPMKTFFGIETLKLKGRRVEGGWRVKGTLPWVSNLAPENIFGTIFEVEGAPTHRVMFLADCDGEGVTIRGCEPFLAMDGTGTYAIHFRDAFVPDDHVLADPIDSYLKKIRAGFILLQSGMAIGTIRDCIAIMKEMKPPLGHVNRYLEVQPEDMEAELSALEAELAELMKTPYDLSQGYFRRVVAARLAAGEATVKAAHYAMLHAGARGYVQASRAQRRLREAYFVAIVTPATKQLRKMLADMGPLAAH